MRIYEEETLEPYIEAFACFGGGHIGGVFSGSDPGVICRVI